MNTEDILKEAKQRVKSLCDQEPMRKHIKRLKKKLPGVYEHSVVVARLAVALGVANNYNNSDLRMLAAGGLLHDIGKLDIDTDILHKARSLTEDEKKEVQKHPRAGFQRLEESFFQEIRKIVVAHHEHQADPYPREEGRQNESTAEKLSVVITAADMFAALAADREYKDSLSEKEIEEIMHEEFTGPQHLVDQILELGSLAVKWEVR